MVLNMMVHGKMGNLMEKVSIDYQIIQFMKVSFNKEIKQDRENALFRMEQYTKVHF